MHQQSIIVHAWEKLQQVLFTDSYNEYLQRYRSAYVYRGMEDCTYTDVDRRKIKDKQGMQLKVQGIYKADGSQGQ